MDGVWGVCYIMRITELWDEAAEVYGLVVGYRCCGVVTRPITVQCRLDVLITRAAWGLHGGEFIRPPPQPCAYIYSSVLDFSALPSVHIAANFIFTYNSQLPLHTTIFFYNYL